MNEGSLWQLSQWSSCELPVYPENLLFHLNENGRMDVQGLLGARRAPGFERRGGVGGGRGSQVLHLLCWRHTTQFLPLESHVKWLKCAHMGAVGMAFRWWLLLPWHRYFGWGAHSVGYIGWMFIPEVWRSTLEGKWVTWYSCVPTRAAAGAPTKRPTAWGRIPCCRSFSSISVERRRCPLNTRIVCFCSSCFSLENTFTV